MQMLTLLSREQSERGRGAGGEADRKVKRYLNSNYLLHFPSPIMLSKTLPNLTFPDLSGVIPE